ncbi:hypothetical protein EPUS_03888 [Endocarpon pusillum Z07020]|uniref:Uncharacterized protein n=1 Tax=Endocarpon pusillum (strain Z07020 / HMAS-L-300199) TaxID=1263415 RepID=U1HUW0_ENDPU|nr:uncharacterized protein EPUS_03888 [Endocarpon pusillum Z07020]ERF74450.1 hypothetical protein EPUS_03888 [Endocarpon pusillum Z07020]
MGHGFPFHRASPWNRIKEVFGYLSGKLRSLSDYSCFIKQIQCVMGFYSHAQSFEDTYVPILAVRQSSPLQSAGFRSQLVSEDMAKHREKKRAQRQHEEVYPMMTFYPPLLTRPRSLTPAEEPVVSTPVTRVVRSRVINPGNRSLENTEAGSSNPTNLETRYQQPILDGGVKPLQKTTTAHAQKSEATADFQAPILPAQPPFIT